eukprot:CAMPEP_0179203880 /NCGR_PEP_ID=MMETSP0796-20121207/101632_1 /TAXON_ID=73915 /ORGANISM="Pyrodinium bahamense, Strain pbaha01" /LENGTH=152 /DNA_ID=CAMNT_0020908753 /DNA_START=283 /DNA_END=739 /DNA_ORIENTATION=+
MTVLAKLMQLSSSSKWFVDPGELRGRVPERLSLSTEMPPDRHTGHSMRRSNHTCTEAQCMEDVAKGKRRRSSGPIKSERHTAQQDPVTADATGKRAKTTSVVPCRTARWRSSAANCARRRCSTPKEPMPEPRASRTASERLKVSVTSVSIPK